MRDERFLQQIKEVRELRSEIDRTGPTFDSRKTRADVVRVYGRPVSRTTWHRWREKCGVSADLLDRYGGDYPAGAYLLLMVNARLNRGNGPDERSRKVTRAALVRAVKNTRRRAIAASLGQMPETLTRTELIGYAEAKAGREYHFKTHQKRGITRTKALYTRAEAVAILSLYPSFINRHEHQEDRPNP